MSESEKEASVFPFKTDVRMILTGTPLEEPLRKICISVDAMSVAMALSHGYAKSLANFSPESTMIFDSPISGLTVIIPCYSVLAAALKNIRFEPIFIEFKTDFEEPPDEFGRDIRTVEHFFRDVTAAQFVLFFEQNYTTMKKAVSFNHDRLEGTWRFARRVRDAISHGDVFTINDPNFVPVSWRGYTIGRERNAESMASAFTAGDLIVLMCELERAMPR